MQPSSVARAKCLRKQYRQECLYYTDGKPCCLAPEVLFSIAYRRRRATLAESGPPADELLREASWETELFSRDAASGMHWLKSIFARIGSPSGGARNATGFAQILLLLAILLIPGALVLYIIQDFRGKRKQRQSPPAEPATAASNLT